MKPGLLLTATFLGDLIMYRFYGRFAAKKRFSLKSKKPDSSVELNDGIYDQPTKRPTHSFANVTEKKNALQRLLLLGTVIQISAALALTVLTFYLKNKINIGQLLEYQHSLRHYYTVSSQ